MNPRIPKQRIAAALAALLLPWGVAHAQPTSESAPAITELGPHHRVWEWTSRLDDGQGGWIESKHSYTELAAGMHYNQGEQWFETKERIQLFQKGAVAREGPCKVIWPSQLSADEEIDVLTADGQRFRSRVLGLSFYDPTTGQSVLFAELKPSQAQLTAPNRLVYPDAFSDILADLAYVYRRSGLSQEVVVRGKLPSPAEFGLDPESTWLEVVTEFLEAPVPARTEHRFRPHGRPNQPPGQLEPEAIDEQLEFGDYRLGPGRAFGWGAEAAPAPVFKRWQVIDRRNILFEQVHWPSVSALAEGLPKQARTGSATESTRRVASAERRLPPGRTVVRAENMPLDDPTVDRPSPDWHERAALLLADSSHSDTAPEEAPATATLAAARPDAGHPPGLVLDYELVTGQTDFTFKGDATYLVTGRVWLYGQTTFEGNAVIKFRVDIPSELPWLALAYGTVNCRTGPYRPVVFTAKDDNSVGEVIPGSTGSPGGYYAEYGLYLYQPSAAVSLAHLQMRWLKLGVLFSGGSGHLLRHGQFVECSGALYASYAGVNAENLLLDNTHWRAAAGVGGSIQGAHWTVDRVGYLSQMSGGTLTLVNSLLVGVTNWGYNYTTSYSAAPAPAGVFRSVGGGAHYLSTGSPHRNTGTANIAAPLASDLRHRTTYAPIELTSHFTANTTLGPQAQRDTDTPDLGFHYDPLDYIWSALNLCNGTLVLTNGVAVGVGGNKGVILQAGAKFVSEGTPTTLNRYLRYQAVQERPWGSAPASFVLLDLSGAPAPPPEVFLRLTEVSFLADASGRRQLLQTAGNVLNSLAISHSQVTGMYYSQYAYHPSSMTIAWTNNIFRRCNLTWYQPEATPGYYPFTLHLQNNLFSKGAVYFSHNDSGTAWTVRDNLFDSDVLSNSSTYALTASHNGYRAGLSSLGGTGNQTGLTMDFVSGPAANWYGVLGEYYYPASGSSPSLACLIDADNVRTPASVGLYHFTTVAAANSKETTSNLDIGFHYVGVGNDLAPKDTDGDGWPDYFEDRNGNGGNPDPGETNWQVSENGTTGVPGLQVYSPLE